MKDMFSKVRRFPCALAYVFAMLLVTNPATANGQVGRCCSNLGQADMACMDGLTAEACAAVPSVGAPDFAANTTCTATPCCDCTSDSECLDPLAPGAPDNLCTANVCVLGCSCSFPPLYDVTTTCCNPKFGLNGGLTPLDDGNECTADACHSATGFVTHEPLSGTPCDDQHACTWDDQCESGICAGIEVAGTECLTDGDCPAGVCELSTGQCECHAVTPLCLKLLGKQCSHSGASCLEDADCGAVGGVCMGEYADPQCLDAGQLHKMAVHIGPGDTEITSGQFVIRYDTTCVDNVSIGPCAGDTVFTHVVYSEVDRNAGRIFYAVQSSSQLVPPRGTSGPYNLACVSFRKKSNCLSCSFCLTDENPQRTVLTDRYGMEAATASCGCSEPIRSTGSIALSAPVSQSVHVDCGEPVATVEWPTPLATDSCQGLVGFVCKGHHESGLPLPTATVYEGGPLPPGNSDFVCTATNSCGVTVARNWTVSVSPQQVMEVQLQLQPLMNNNGVFQRAVTFDLYSDCASEPVSTCAEMSFQGPYNFAGHARGTINVEYGNYLCVTAQDHLHTLRSIVAFDDLACVNKKWQVSYRGDPLLGGNWLISGNLDGNRPGTGYGDRNTINILDFGTFIAELAHGSSYGNQGDTTCETTGPHADLNADGVIDSLDYAFILENFLSSSEGLCCPSSLGSVAAEFNPATAFSIKELRKAGFADLVVADLNEDGMLDLKDMNAFAQGIMPTNLAPPVRYGKGRAR